MIGVVNLDKCDISKWASRVRLLVLFFMLQLCYNYGMEINDYKYNMETTNIFSKNLLGYLKDDIAKVINQGGTSSSKTFSILQLLITIAYNSTRPLLISVVSESMPHLKRGCIRDFINILGGAYDVKKHNRTDSVYHIGNSKIEFFGADDSARLRGGRRDILYINECNNVSKKAYDELEVRTKLKTFLDFNPVSEFWAHDMENDTDVMWIHSTYLDAKHVLPESIVKSIESRRDKDPNWWRVYGMGLVGNIENLCHPYFKVMDKFPDNVKNVFYALDFGYSQDPAALVKIGMLGDNLYFDELIYETGLDNNQLAKRFADFGIRKNHDEIFADSAEPKSIHEIRIHGYNIKAAPKGKDSITNGIQKINQYKQFWTKRSINGIKEQRNYRYIENSDGRITTKPMDDFNHLMDARRYGVVGKTSFIPIGAAKIRF